MLELRNSWSRAPALRYAPGRGALALWAQRHANGSLLMRAPIYLSASRARRDVHFTMLRWLMIYPSRRGCMTLRMISRRLADAAHARERQAAPCLHPSFNVRGSSHIWRSAGSPTDATDASASARARADPHPAASNDTGSTTPGALRRVPVNDSSGAPAQRRGSAPCRACARARAPAPARLRRRPKRLRSRL